MTPKNLTLDAYRRVSRKNGRDGDSYLSPDQQREKIEAYAAMHGYTLVWHETEEDVSGSKMSRPIFDEVLRRIEARETQGVIVAKADRFARSLVGALAAIERIEKAGGHFISVAENFDTTTPNGRLMLNIMLSFAQFELERIKDSWRDAQRSAIDRGVWIGRAPFGYRATIKGVKANGRSEYGPLEEHPINGPIVREAYRIGRFEGITLAVHYLIDHGLSPSGARRLFANDAYRGVATAAGVAPALVGEEEWQACQIETRDKRAAGAYPLTGVLTCGCESCQVSKSPHRLSGQLQTVRGKSYRRYRVEGKEADGSRAKGHVSISADLAEGVVRTDLSDALEGDWQSERPGNAAVEAALNGLDAAQRELDAYNELATAIDQATFVKGIKTRTERRDAAATRYRDLVADDKPLPEARELDNPATFRRATLAMVKSITVRPTVGEIVEGTDDQGHIVRAVRKLDGEERIELEWN